MITIDNAAAPLRTVFDAVVEDGEAGGLSLGGDMAAMQKPIGGGVSYIRDVLDLAEVSVVTVPGNPGALIQEYAVNR
ncbi:hypothetical protein ACG873_01395 (plasmid) [Mesorhizobium sp. AaZ16]|uniref:hypothetical protein n=1 Tax=Mesorhizobium sp. AaZ16 TaxID=3402289 RepID=UPI00374E70B6